MTAGEGDAIGQWLNTQLPGLVVSMPRFAAAFMVLPLLVRKIVPRMVRNGFFIMLALVACPAVAAAGVGTGWGSVQWAVFLAKEVFIGAMIGYAVGLSLWVLMAVGDLVDHQAGFTNVQIFDPFGGHARGPFSVLMSQLAVMMFMGFGGLHVLMQLLYESLLLWPPGFFVPHLGVEFRDLALSSSATMLEAATRLAAPVIACLLLVELGIGLINRAASQLNSFYFSMPIKAITAILVLALLLAHLADVFEQQILSAQHLLSHWDRVLQKRP